MRDVFNGIYETNFWGSAESLSGNGSTIEQTALVRSRLPELLHYVGARSLLDIPCGDFNWMREVDLGSIEYMGADIVPALIDVNRERYPDRRFSILDICLDDLPSVDVILVRDCLPHFSYGDCFAAIANLIRSGSLYLIATTYPDAVNENIETGSWRPIDLRKAPFKFPEPLLLVNEGMPASEKTRSDKSLGLWKLGR